MKLIKFTSLCLFAFLIVFNACKKDENFTTDAGAKLSFSTDTLRFDTVFTQLGSATRYFKVFNRNDKPIRIAKIALGNKAPATYNLNIDGIAGRSFTNVEIGANDSIYVFAEVTINPNAPLSISPFVVSEDLIFETNGNSQRVVIESWGQNANYLPNFKAKGSVSLLSAGNSNTVINWDDKKPYVIYGVLFVDSCTLRIAAGTHIYVHGGFATTDKTLYRDGIIYVLPNAKIEAKGTLAQPIIIEGDRLEKEFANEADQWAGLIIGNRSQGNVLNFTTIRNSRVGIRLDSAANLTLNSCKIYNTASSGFLGIHSTLKAENCLFYGGGGSSAQLEYGGVYDFKYCTMAGFGSKIAALSANNFKCVEQNALGKCVRAIGYPLSMTASNCIFYGSKDDEISFFDVSGAGTIVGFNYDFKNCIVRVKDLLKPENTPDFLTKCKDCINADVRAKLFKKSSEGDYHLDTLSIAEMKALPITNILSDIEGKLRDVQKPDIGCFEYQYK